MLSSFFASVHSFLPLTLYFPVSICYSSPCWYADFLPELWLNGEKVMFSFLEVIFFLSLLCVLQFSFYLFPSVSSSQFPAHFPARYAKCLPELFQEGKICVLSLLQVLNFHQFSYPFSIFLLLSLYFPFTISHTSISKRVQVKKDKK